MKIENNVKILLSVIVSLIVIVSMSNGAIAFIEPFTSGEGPSSEIWYLSGSNPGEILDSETGSVIGSTPYTGDKVMPAENNETDLVWNYSTDKIEAYDSETNNLLWDVPVDDETNGRDMWERNSEFLVTWIVAGDGTYGNLTAFYVRNGTMAWTIERTSNSNSRQLIVDDTYIYVIPSSSLQQIWVHNGTSVRSQSGNIRGMTSDNTYVYHHRQVSSSENYVVKRYRSNFTKITENSDGIKWHNQRFATSEESDKVFLSAGGALRAYWKSNMTRIYSVVTESGASNNPQEIWFDGNHVYGWDQTNGDIVLYDPDTGSETARWNYPTTNEPGPSFIYFISTTNETIDLQVKNYMEHDSKQKYTVILENEDSTTEDITEQATVLSNNTSIITVDETNNTIISTSNITTNDIASVKAEYDLEGVTLSDSEEIVIANSTMENIDILPNTKWLNTFAGVNEPGLEYGLGAEIQWIFFIILMMVTTTHIAQSKWIGLGTGEILLILFWLTEFIGLGMFLGSMIFGIFMILTQMGRNDQNVTIQQPPNNDF